MTLARPATSRALATLLAILAPAVILQAAMAQDSDPEAAESAEESGVDGGGESSSGAPSSTAPGPQTCDDLTKSRGLRSE